MQTFLEKKAVLLEKRTQIQEGTEKELRAGNEAKAAQAASKNNMAELDRQLEKEEFEFYKKYKQLAHIIDSSGKSDKTQEMYKKSRKEQVSTLAIFYCVFLRLANQF